MKCAVGGCEGSPVELATGPIGDGPSGIAVDSSSIYWQTLGLEGTPAASTPAQSVAVAGPECSLCLPAAVRCRWHRAGCYECLLDGQLREGTHLREVWMRRKPDGASLGQDYAGGIAVDAAAVYWTIVTVSGVNTAREWSGEELCGWRVW